MEYDITTGIDGTISQGTNADKKVVRQYSIDGRETKALHRGINIVRYDDGIVKKVIVR